MMDTNTGKGIPRTDPAPTNTIDGSSIKIAEVSDIATDNPANTFMDPSVTIKAGMPRVDTSNPFNTPTNVPHRIAATLASKGP